MKLSIGIENAPQEPATRDSANYAFPRHAERSVDLFVPASAAFEFLDCHRNISAHMEQRNIAMLGGSMTTEIDSLGGTAEGSVIRITGRFLGIPIALAERVIQRDPPNAKTWETFGATQLIVISDYRMGFHIEPTLEGCHVTVWIDYALPSTVLGRLLCPFIAPLYADWCLVRILDIARAAFADRNAAALNSTRNLH